MNDIQIITPKTKAEMKVFIRFGLHLYAGCPFYVPDFESDLWDQFNPKKNPALKTSEVQPFLAIRNGKVAGRIAVFYNTRTNERWHVRQARFMLFDFIDDEAVSSALLKAAEDWSRSKGMTELIGPMGFTDFDKEGILLSDFHIMGSVNTLYNYPYYPTHLDHLGYEKAADWIQVRMQVPPHIPDRYTRVSRLVKDRFHLTIRTVTAHDIRHRGYGEKIFRLFNEAYAPLFGFTEIDAEQTAGFVKLYLPLIDLRLVPIVENQQGELIGVAVCMTNLSETMRRTNGRLFPFGWWQFLKALKWKHSQLVDLLLIGVRPDYQNKGVNAPSSNISYPRSISWDIPWPRRVPSSRIIQKSCCNGSTSIHRRSSGAAATRRCYKLNKVGPLSSDILFTVSSFCPSVCVSNCIRS